MVRSQLRSASSPSTTRALRSKIQSLHTADVSIDIFNTSLTQVIRKRPSPIQDVVYVQHTNDSRHYGCLYLHTKDWAKYVETNLSKTLLQDKKL